MMRNRTIRYIIAIYLSVCCCTPPASADLSERIEQILATQQQVHFSIYIAEARTSRTPTTPMN